MINRHSKMNSYVHHVGFTAWRKKSALLLATGLFLLIVFSLEYTKLDDRPFFKHYEHPRAVLDAQSNSNIKFMNSGKKSIDNVKTNAFTDHPRSFNINNQDEILMKRTMDNMEIEQQLGIPYVNLDSVHPFVPKKRIVHLDFKGAPPLIGFLRKFFAFVRNLGATGVLLGKQQVSAD